MNVIVGSNFAVTDLACKLHHVIIFHYRVDGSIFCMVVQLRLSLVWTGP